jgi:SAM-dependent methyltransferase
MSEMKVNPRYQDYVIKDGKLVGDFEGLYKNFDDPWHQSREDHAFDSRRTLAVSWCNYLRKKYQSNRIVELGCGFGHLTEQLRQQNFASIGVDISETAIEKARLINPSSIFFTAGLQEFEAIKKFDPDIFLMAEITWYVLDDLEKFIRELKAYKNERNKPTFLIHLLTTYAPGVQKYGADKFTNLEEIKKFFGMKYLETGFIQTPREDDPFSQGTFFIAEL